MLNANIMDLKLANKRYIVGGASSGLGEAILRRLVAEGAQVIAVARREDRLNALAEEFNNVIPCVASVTDGNAVQKIMDAVGDQKLDGILVNAGGPPANRFTDTSLEDWDDAYKLLLRWKVDLVQKLIPIFERQGFGRILFLESVSVKQPVANLVLSNSMRMAIVGMSKTISEEHADKGITSNVIGPGFHDTNAIVRVLEKKAELQGISFEEAKQNQKESIPVKKIGDPDNFASLAAWLLSPLSEYITGQTISVDGGAVKYSLG